LASPIELELRSKGLQQVVSTKEITINDGYMDWQHKFGHLDPPLSNI
jgi:hypothetical protein